MAFVDIQLSAPKDVSVLAMVGGDERVREAFTASVKVVLAEMEKFAAVRERRGEAKVQVVCFNPPPTGPIPTRFVEA